MYVTGFGRVPLALGILLIVVLLQSPIPQIIATPTPQQSRIESSPSTQWVSWASTAWSYFAPGVGVNSATGLHMSNLNFHCFTDWDLASYIMSIIYAYKLGLITSGGTCTGTQSNTWEFDCRIKYVMNFLMHRPLSNGTPYDFYSSDNSNPFQQCSTNDNGLTNAADTGRLLSALSILETVTGAYDSDVSTILGRSSSTYNQFASTCCNGADYYAYLIAEGFYAFQSAFWPSAGCCGVFSAIDSYSGPYCPSSPSPPGTIPASTLPIINTNSEPLNLEILLGQQHSTDAHFLGFAQSVYGVQKNIWSSNGSLTAWTEGVYPSYPPSYESYVYEWVEDVSSGSCEPWRILDSNLNDYNPQNPALDFTKTAFSYLAIYGSNPYTDALVNAVSALASSTGFGEAVQRNGASAENLYTGSGQPSTNFYSDKTQEQVLEAAFYAITHSPTFVSFGSSISSVVSTTSAGSVWFILPDYTAGQGSVVHTSASKCGSGEFAALATDVYAGTYLFGALTTPQQNEILDTNSAYISQSASSCGQPSNTAMPASQPLVAVAGPFVDEVVHYYEVVQASSPLYYNAGTGCFVSRASGVSLDCSTPTPTNDVFIMETFTDSANRMVFIIYGRAWPGSLAGFEYLVNFVLKNPSNYPNAWYVYRWQDASSGVSANSIPDPGDTYTQIASGP